MKYIFWSLITIGVLLSVGLLVRNNLIVEATRPQCVSVGAQCGTDNGTYFTYACPQGYQEGLGNTCWRWHNNHFQFADKVQVSHECNTGVIQYDSCDPVGQCPTGCGLPESTVSDGEGGEMKCDATPACPIPEPEVLCTDTTALNYGDASGSCRYAGPASAPQAPACKDLGVYSPTITSVGRVDSDTVMACYTKPSDNADAYEIWYGISEDNLPWNTVTKDLCVELSGNELVNTHVWLKVAGKSEGCVGNFSIVTDP